MGWDGVFPRQRGRVRGGGFAASPALAGGGDDGGGGGDDCFKLASGSGLPGCTVPCL